MSSTLFYTSKQTSLNSPDISITNKRRLYAAARQQYHCYEGLENQLIMELAAWDFLNVQLMALIAKTGKSLSEMNTEPVDPEDSDEGGRIKKITTGPTEVEYFDKISESISSMWKYYTQALQPGGIIDELRKNLCTLAQRLEIFIPFCDPSNRLRVPWVVNHRRPGPLDGPNPTAPIKKSRSFNK